MGNHGGEVTMVVIGGTNRQLTSRHVATILGMSWGAFILSWLANGVYYQVLRRHFTTVKVIFRFNPLQLHPSCVDMEVRKKLQIRLFGKNFFASCKYNWFK